MKALTVNVSLIEIAATLGVIIQGYMILNVIKTRLVYARNVYQKNHKNCRAYDGCDVHLDLIKREEIY